MGFYLFFFLRAIAMTADAAARTVAPAAASIPTGILFSLGVPSSFDSVPSDTVASLWSFDGVLSVEESVEVSGVSFIGALPTTVKVYLPETSSNFASAPALSRRVTPSALSADILPSFISNSAESFSVSVAVVFAGTVIW